MTPIEQYIFECPQEHRARLSRLREIILQTAPGLTEKISWGMPTFYKKGNVIHFALHKTHVGLYPGPEAIRHFEERLKPYKTSKGAIQLPLKDALPEELVTDITRFCAGVSAP